jgi:hypothetical protein
VTDERHDLSQGSGWWEASDGRWYPPVDRRPPPPLPPPPDPTYGDTTPAGAWLAIAGGAMAAIGSLLPWEQIGTFARNGFQLGAHDSVTFDGPACLILGIVTIVIGITRLTNSAMPRFIQRSTIVTGVLVGLVLAGDYSSIHHSVNQITASGEIASIGYGYWVCGVGAVVAVAGGIVLRSGQPSRGLGDSRVWLVLILVLGAAGVLLSLKAGSGTATSTVSSTSTTTTTTLDTLPPPTFAQDYQDVHLGCLSLQGVGGFVSQASDQNSTAPLTSGSSGPQWRYVSGMEVVGNDPAYQQIAGEARTFINTWTVAETTGSLTAVNDSIARLVVDCQALNLYPQ